MVDKPNKTPLQSDNTVHESETDPVDKSIIRKIWKKSTVTELQQNLLRRLTKLKLGTRKVEEQFMGLANDMKVEKNKTRDVDEILNVMNKKVADAERCCKYADKRKSRARRRLEEKLGKNTRRTKNVLKQMNKEMTKLRRTIKEKNQKKIDFLIMKFLKPVTEQELDEKLIRYKDISILKNVKKDPEANVEVIVI